MNSGVTTVPAAATPRPLAIRVAASLLGAIAVALAAQVAVPIPGTPVPMTLQPLAVLAVGGLLGPRFGALAMVSYLAMGAAGLPVFTPLGAPGAARLVGPTGGYLLAYPFAAAVTGLLAARAISLVQRGIAAAAGLAVIHAGGMLQLLVLTGSAEAAFAAGVLPFVVKDTVNLVVVALVIQRFRPITRALN